MTLQFLYPKVVAGGSSRLGPQALAWHAGQRETCIDLIFPLTRGTSLLAIGGLRWTFTFTLRYTVCSASENSFKVRHTPDMRRRQRKIPQMPSLVSRRGQPWVRCRHHLQRVSSESALGAMQICWPEIMAPGAAGPMSPSTFAGGSAAGAGVIGGRAAAEIFYMPVPGASRGRSIYAIHPNQGNVRRERGCWPPAPERWGMASLTRHRVQRESFHARAPLSHTDCKRCSENFH